MRGERGRPSPEAYGRKPSAFKQDTVGQRIQGMRMRRGLTQIQLRTSLAIEGVRVSVSLVQNWELDRCRPNADQLLAVCRVLRCSSDYILGHKPVTNDTRTGVATHNKE